MLQFHFKFCSKLKLVKIRLKFQDSKPLEYAIFCRICNAYFAYFLGNNLRRNSITSEFSKLLVIENPNYLVM